jgi:hypothetical protein
MNTSNNSENKTAQFKPAATVNLPDRSWVKVLSLRSLVFPHLSKGGVVLKLIDDRHDQMLKDLGQFLHGDTNSLDTEGTPND